MDIPLEKDRLVATDIVLTSSVKGTFPEIMKRLRKKVYRFAKEIEEDFDAALVDKESSEASGRIQRFLEDISHKDMIAEMERKGIYETFTLLAALHLVEQAIPHLRKGDGILFNLSTPSISGAFCWLTLYCDHQGLVELYKDEVYLNGVWFASFSVVSGNK